MMDGGRTSDFSIDRILSPQLGLKPPVEFPQDHNLQGAHRGFRMAPRSLGFPAPLPVWALNFRQNQRMDFGEFHPHGAGFHHANLDIHSNPGVYPRISSQDPAVYQQFPGYHGNHQAGPSAQLQHRQRTRMRTVFTETQREKLEALFGVTDYPTAEARADVAEGTGLSEETVRVWFKNRRARRKRQSRGSKVNPASPAGSAGGDRSLFDSFL